MTGLHDVLEPIELTPPMADALLALSYVSPVHENYLWLRMRAHHATISALIARGLVRREDYFNRHGLALPFLALTREGNRRREALVTGELVPYQRRRRGTASTRASRA